MIRYIELGNPSDIDPVHRVTRVDAPPSQHSTFNYAAKTADRGRAAWEYIHTTKDDPEIAIKKFESMIPSFGCSCMKEYKQYKKDHPPDFSSPDALFAWGVDLHNWVNAKLFKPVVSIDEARRIWGR